MREWRCDSVETSVSNKDITQTLNDLESEGWTVFSVIGPFIAYAGTKVRIISYRASLT